MDCKDALTVMNWSDKREDDPVYEVARRWIVGEEPSRQQIMEALQEISKCLKSPWYQHHLFEVMQVRRILLNSLDEHRQFDLEAVEDSLDKKHSWDLQDSWPAFRLWWFVWLPAGGWPDVVAVVALADPCHRSALEKGYNGVCKECLVDLETTLLLDWNDVMSLSCHGLTGQAAERLVHLLEKEESLFARVRQQSISRLRLPTNQYRFVDHFGVLYESLVRGPLFADAKNQQGSTRERNRFILNSIQTLMTRTIKFTILKAHHDVRRERRASLEKKNWGGESVPVPNNISDLTEFVVELIDKSRPTRSDMAGFAFFYRRFERSSHHVELINRYLNLLWPRQVEEARRKLEHEHELAEERLRHNRDYSKAIEKQNRYIENLELELETPQDTGREERIKNILERRYALRERLREQWEQEASTVAMGSWILPLTQRQLANLFDPHDETAVPTWGRYGNRFKAALIQHLESKKGMTA